MDDRRDMTPLVASELEQGGMMPTVDEEPDRAEGQARRRTGWLSSVILAAGLLAILTLVTAAYFVYAGQLQLVWRGDATVAEAVQPLPGQLAGAAASGPVQGREVERRQIGDWIIVCLAGPGDGRSCSIRQQLVAGENRQTLLIWQLAHRESGELASAWFTPGAVLLSRGVTMQYGDRSMTIPYESCGGGLCVASAILAPEIGEGLPAAGAIKVRFALPGQDLVELQISTAGLEDALEALGEEAS